MRYLALVIVNIVILLISSTCFAVDFPYRDKYPELNIIELVDLKSAYDKGDLVVVDLRSELEYETIQIKGAIHLSYGHAKFNALLAKIAEQNPNKKIAVYDNGVDCIKSYKAAEDALYGMIPNVYVFDAGIATWAQAYPSATLLLGNELTPSKAQIISVEKTSNSHLDFDTFIQQAGSKDAVVIDTRDPIQRTQKLPGLENAMLIPIDKLVKNIIKKGHMKNKQLYIFDQVGRQVKWLMYYLVDNGYTNFYFLDGGATAVLKEQVYRVSSYQ